jgi:hypothetical protein
VQGRMIAYAPCESRKRFSYRHSTGVASLPALDTERKSTVISDTLNACRMESVIYCMGCSECMFHKSPFCKIAFRLSTLDDALEVHLLGVILRPSYAQGKSAYEIRCK